MWPRNDLPPPPGAEPGKRSKSTGLNGFVSFMTRYDAEDALREFDGYDWNGCILRVGWSKAVPIAAKPLYGPFFKAISIAVKTLKITFSLSCYITQSSR